MSSSALRLAVVVLVCDSEPDALRCLEYASSLAGEGCCWLLFLSGGCWPFVTAISAIATATWLASSESESELISLISLKESLLDTDVWRASGEAIRRGR